MSSALRLTGSRWWFVLAVLFFFLPGSTARAACPGTPGTIEAENCLPGNPSSEWDITGAGDPALQGFATDISVDQGQTVSFKVESTTIAAYRIDIYRLGYYQGNGARFITTIPNGSITKTDQPACLHDTVTGLRDCGNWSVSASWSVPASATSGIYIARLVREDGPAGASHMIFVVRDDDGGSEILFQTSDTTWQAYNRWGGNSLYWGDGRLRPAPPTPKLPAARTRSATTGPSTRSKPRPRTGSSTPSTRWCAGWSRTGTTSATSPASTPTAAGTRSWSTRSSSRWGTTSTGRGRSERTSRRRVTTPRLSTSASSAATRSSGRRGGRRAPTGRTRPTAPWSATRRRTPTPRSTL